MAKEEESNCFYVGIKDPSEFRRDLLECSKKVIGSLKRYETFKDIRKEKIETVINLVKIIRELAFLNNKLKSALPKTSIRAMDIKKKEKPEKEAKKEQGKTKAKPQKKHEATTIEKLEKELSEIENKLVNL